MIVRVDCYCWQVPRVIVAVHQPNYMPWLGYFHKLVRADVFVLLDDAQFSKNSYTNRVRIALDGHPHWLTIPVHVFLGQAINAVRPANDAWRTSHLSLLRNAYGAAAHFRAVWPDVESWIVGAPGGDIAAVNGWIIGQIVGRIGARAKVLRSSELEIGAKRADARLAAIVKAVAPTDAVYLSGSGGAKYQREATFVRSGIALRYADFVHPVYAQGDGAFLPGLSILDAAFHQGWREAGRLAAA
jgi:hypothetical protein